MYKSTDIHTNTNIHLKLYIYIYIYEDKEYIFKCFKDDHLWFTVFIADFGFLHIMSTQTTIPTWVWNYQAAFLTALCYITFFLFSHWQNPYLLSSALVNGKSSSLTLVYIKKYTLCTGFASLLAHSFLFWYVLFYYISCGAQDDILS